MLTYTGFDAGPLIAVSMPANVSCTQKSTLSLTPSCSADDARYIDTREGKALGGRPLGRGALLHLLRNATYVRRIPHKEVTYRGS